MNSIPRHIHMFLIASMVGAVCLAGGAQADWPQIGGPDRNGISGETGLAREWPEAGPRTLWSVPLGAGFAGAAIRDGEVYVLDRLEEGKDVLRCFELASGRELWTCAYDAPGEVDSNGSRTPPTVTEKYVYSAGMMGHLYCIDRKTHKPVWNRNINDDFGISDLVWGVVQAPSLYKNLVIIAPQAPNATVAAYDRLTGELVWKSDGFGAVGYSTPVIATLAGVDQAVMITAMAWEEEDEGDEDEDDAKEKGPVAGSGRVVGISLTDGKVLWEYSGYQCAIPIPFATPLSNDRLFVTGEYGAGSVMLQIVRDGDGLKVKELYKTDVCGSQIHQPILYQDHFYMNSNGNSRRDGMLCLTLDGEMKWRTRRRPNFERGGLLLADNLIFNLDGREGTLHMIDPSPEGYKELAQTKVFEGEEMWAPLAISDGKLVLRSQEEMKCLDLRNP